MISASSGLCSIADRVLFIILFASAKGFSTSVTSKSQMLNLFVWIAAEFFLNIMLSFTKFWNCVSPISTIDLIRSNIKSGMTIESLCILCSFVDLNEFIGNSLDNVLMSKIQYIDQNFFHELIL